MIFSLDWCQRYFCVFQKTEIGQTLFDAVCKTLNIVEKAYFGLSYQDNKDKRCWLNNERKIIQQTRNKWLFSFEVKFFIVKPEILHEDTRYNFCQQVRKDIFYGK